MPKNKRGGGKILLGITLLFFCLFIFSFVALAAPGDLDETFGRGGIASYNFLEGDNDGITRMVISPDETIYAVSPLSSNLLQVIPFRSTGRNSSYNPFLPPDNRFANHLFAIFNQQIQGRGLEGLRGRFFDLALQQESEGSFKILAGGYVQSIRVPIPSSRDPFDVYQLDFALTRLLPTDRTSVGAVDLSFGPPVRPEVSIYRDHLAGRVVVDFGKHDFATRLKIQQDGKILLIGRSCDISRSDGRYINCQIALARFQSNGILDVSFDGDGKVLLNLGLITDVWALDAAILPDGKILVLGNTRSGYGSTSDPVLVRLNENGSIDRTFGTDGVVSDNFGTYYRRPSEGSCHFDVSTPTQDVFSGLAVDARNPTDYKIIIAGGSNGDFALARYNREGHLDEGFGPCGGKVVTDFLMTPGIDTSIDIAYEVAMDPRGYIIAVGEASGNIALARYRPTGWLDTGFGPHRNGKVTTDLGGNNDAARTVVLRRDSRILVGGKMNPSCGRQNCTDAVFVQYLGGMLPLQPIGEGLPENLINILKQAPVNQSENDKQKESPKEENSFIEQEKERENFNPKDRGIP